MKRLHHKLQNIIAGQTTAADFIIADAKDGDMGFALAAPGPAAQGGFRSVDEYLTQIRQIIAQDIIDICLVSASTLERLADEGIFIDSDITPAVRANDSTDIWNNRHGHYLSEPSRPHRAVDLGRARASGCILSLYSMTFMGDVENDLRTMQAFHDFRTDAHAAGMTYFLEVFNPNVGGPKEHREIGAFVNDCITRALAPLTLAERPRFLKIAYNGGESLRELVHYDSRTVVGILGGSSGTMMDTFTLVERSVANGARVVLFGRKINLSESPLDTVRLMRAVADGDLKPVDAVHAYHKSLQEKHIAPVRTLVQDAKLTDSVLLNDDT